MGHVARESEREDLTFYPGHDDMGESALQRLMTELLRPLLARFLAEQGVIAFVGADQFIYYIQGNPKCVVVPDVYVMPGVDPGVAPRHWKAWESRIAPSFALEIMSEIDDLKDVVHAPQRHDELGTKELVVFDPYIEASRGRTRFRVHRRDARGKLTMVEATNRDRVKSLVLGCFLRCVGEGEQMRLRLGTGRQGVELFPTDAEQARSEAERAKSEAERAKSEAERAEAAELAKAQAEQEIARLRAELAALQRAR
jgi:hypothetical protein